jgi:hypothetical protein
MTNFQSFLLLTFLLVLSGFGSSASARLVTQQEWQCDVDLHQGDSGVLFLIRAEGKVKGGIKIDSNTTPMNHRIGGTWKDGLLNLNRLFRSDVDYAMAATMQRTEKKLVQLGGRYGLAFKGVWSGECKFISERKIQVADSDTDSEPKPDKPVVKAGPSTNVKALPYKPTTKDRIKFSATASHPDGVRSISFILDGQVIKTCRRNRCNASSPPLSAGKHIWRVDAVSKSGFKNPRYPSEMIVKTAPPVVGRCTIMGKATGRSSDIARIFSVSAYGPNNDTKFVASSRFKNGRYELKGLKPGQYKLFADTRADTAIGVHPSQVTVRCRKQKAVERVHKNFEFR